MKQKGGFGSKKRRQLTRNEQTKKKPTGQEEEDEKEEEDDKEMEMTMKTLNKRLEELKKKNRNRKVIQKQYPAQQDHMDSWH